MSDKKTIEACHLPFVFCEIHNDGIVYPCCPDYCKGYSFGDLNTQNLDEIFKSDKVKNFRTKILNNDYSLCNLQICSLRNKDIIDSEKAKNVFLPKYINRL